MNSHDREMHTAIHDLTTERRALRERVRDLEMELQVAREMTREPAPAEPALATAR